MAAGVDPEGGRAVRSSSLDIIILEYFIDKTRWIHGRATTSRGIPRDFAAPEAATRGLIAAPWTPLASLCLRQSSP